MISENLTSLNGKTVKDYDPASPFNPETTAYRLRVDYDGYSNGATVSDMINQLCSDAKANIVEELIIGAFDFEGGDSKDIVDALIQNATKLSKLKVLFIGDITYEENEISWINQCNVSELLKAYPNLEYFGIRGGNNLSFGSGLHHSNLRSLIVESGGLPPNVIQEIGNASLPALEHLELWLGSENYGFGSPVEEILPILNGAGFPKLKYLGLRDSEITDDIAKALTNAAILNQLEVLDLSMGTLGDEGAKALLLNQSIKKLKRLDLHHHYVSEALVDQLKQLGITVDLSDSKEDDEGYRYIQVAE